ncbi:MAG: alpha-N-arabinofuranosidase, partial [Acidobacteriota bacterium]|nr:alpha-N-arabinofuranosidase [Acidobacteriota bacterium]
MNRRNFLKGSMAAATVPLSFVSTPLLSTAAPGPGDPKVAVLLVDTERVMANIDPHIYGQFLEHINHSVEDGLFAEQIRGAGFEGDDFRTYWEPFAEAGQVEIAAIPFQNGGKSVRLTLQGGRAGIRQGRIYIDAGRTYDGFLFVKREEGAPELTLRVQTAQGALIASVALPAPESAWRKVPFSFTSSLRDTEAAIEIVASGAGALLLDFISLMRADVRRDGMLRPDLLQSLQGLSPAFIRWPGGSFASTYKWKEGIGPYPGRGYHPNTFWGGYSDYFGFGTEEFLGLCRKL